MARLRDEDIPYTVVGGLSLFAAPEIRDLEQGLRAIADPHDDVALTRLMTAGPWRLDALEILRVAQAANFDKRHLIEVVQEMVASDGDATAPGTRAKLRRLLDAIEELQPQTWREGPSTILERFLDMTGQVLNLVAADTTDAHRMVANIASLMCFASDWQTAHSKGRPAGFVDYRDAYQAAGGELPTSVELTEDVQGVRLMTLYQAKGLEFRHVFVPALLKGEWPTKEGEAVHFADNCQGGIVADDLSSLIVGVPAPADFDAATYNELNERATSHFEGDLQFLAHWAGGWNALARRYLSAIDQSERWTELIRAHGDAPPPGERQRQEETLFAFFSNAFSIFESFGYAAHTLAAWLEMKEFAEIGWRAVSFRATADRFERHLPDTSIARHMASVRDDESYRGISELRHLLSHRSAPGRLIRRHVGSGGPTGAAEWKLAAFADERWDAADLVLDETATVEPLLWIGHQLPPLVSGLLEFWFQTAPEPTG